MKELSINNSDKRCLLDDEDYKRLKDQKLYLKKWKTSRTYYATLYVNGKSRLVHRYLLNVTDPSQFVDHIDGNGLNNCRSNLRFCTPTQNKSNGQKYRNNKSGYKGVYYEKGRNKWLATITVNGKTIHGGRFPLTDEGKVAAARAYNALAKKHFGEFAHLNDV